MKTESTGKNRIWLWVGLAFFIQLSAWVALFVFSQRNKPAEVPLATAPAKAHHSP